MSSRSWQPGDTIPASNYDPSKRRIVYAGLFVYHGFGVGRYYSVHYTVITFSGNLSEMAASEGLTRYVYVDVLEPHLASEYPVEPKKHVYDYCV